MILLLQLLLDCASSLDRPQLFVSSNIFHGLFPSTSIATQIWPNQRHPYVQYMQTISVYFRNYKNSMVAFQTIILWQSPGFFIFLILRNQENNAITENNTYNENRLNVDIQHKPPPRSLNNSTLSLLMYQNGKNSWKNLLYLQSWFRSPPKSK